MPSVGTLSLSICTEGLMPATPDEGFQLINKPGMAEQSALFFAPKWQPQRLTFFHATGTDVAAIALLAQARGLRRQFLDVNDGQTIFRQALILGCRGTWRDAGQVLGPGLTGGRYEIELTVLILPRPS